MHKTHIHGHAQTDDMPDMHLTNIYTDVHEETHTHTSDPDSVFCATA